LKDFVYRAMAHHLQSVGFVDLQELFPGHSISRVWQKAMLCRETEKQANALDAEK
jgi:hypothetical protein